MPETQMNLEKAPVVEGSAAGNRQFAGTAEAGAEGTRPAGRASRMRAAEVAAAGREPVPVAVSRGLALGVLLCGGLLGGIWSLGLLMWRLGRLLGIWRLRGLKLWLLSLRLLLI